MKEISLGQALIPIFILILLLGLNVYVFEADATYGSNQFALLFSAGIAALLGIRNGVSFQSILDKIAQNIQSTTPAILILLFVGSLAGTWLLSGVVPAMIYYGLNILSPNIFFAATVLICIVVSLATGSSWTTSATIGIALIGIGNGLGLNSAMTAGAVISGAYFGDKMSPLSDTTNLAPAIAGTDLNTHIKYMTITTVPTIIITLIIFLIIGFNVESHGQVDKEVIQHLISSNFNVSPWLFLVPIIVIVAIYFKAPPLMALMIGTLLGGIAAVIFQQDLLLQMTGNSTLSTLEIYRIVMNSISVDTVIPVEEVHLENGKLLDLSGLFQQGGMAGMLGTVWLIICAMAFGGSLDAIGALKRISTFFLSLFNSVFGLFASTVASAMALNITASDQYLSIVITGKMYQEAFKDKGLAPENLSRTLEDAGTVTSVLVPWNTCGAFHSKVLMGEAGNMAFVPYAFFNYISPFMTLFVAAIGFKLKMIDENTEIPLSQ